MNKSVAQYFMIPVIIALASCTSKLEAPNVQTALPLVGVAAMVPTNDAQNEALATQMEAARIELQGEHGLYKHSDGTLGVRDAQRLGTLARALTDSALATTNAALSSGEFTLGEDLYLVSTKLTPQVSFSSGKWWAGIWANFSFSRDEANNVRNAAAFVSASLAPASMMPHATLVSMVTGFVSGSFRACNARGRGVILDIGTYYALPYIYCRSR